MVCCECSLLREFQPCEACPNYEAQRKMNLMKRVVELREQRYKDGCPDEDDLEGTNEPS